MADQIDFEQLYGINADADYQPKIKLVANLLFSEANKGDNAIQDATAIANVVQNRLMRQGRFGKTLEDVIYQPKQFSGVNTKEWNKADKQIDLNDREIELYNHFIQIAQDMLAGNLKDTTQGADHYFNPRLAMPGWKDKMRKTYNSGSHEYYKE